jgi:uncharacterized protein with GYD domain
MSRYILLSTLTPEGRRTLHQHPERMQEVDNEIQTFGCKVVDQYAVLGQYDFVTIVDAPDNETIAHLAVDLGSRGTVNLMTLPAISIEGFAGQLSRSEQLGHN